MAVSTPSPDTTRALVRTTPRSRRAPVAQDVGADLDRLLELIERRPLSALELRVLVQLHAGDATIPELSKALERDSSEVLAAARELAGRGFVRRRPTGPGREGVYSIARAGIVTLRPLLTAITSAGSAG